MFCKGVGKWKGLVQRTPDHLRDRREEAVPTPEGRSPVESCLERNKDLRVKQSQSGTQEDRH